MHGRKFAVLERGWIEVMWAPQQYSSPVFLINTYFTTLNYYGAQR